MSNKSEPHHKFVQTFILAEQPNGYFVLNDIFRYLSNDDDEIVEDEQPQPEVPAEEPPTPATGIPAAETNHEETVVTEAAAEAVDEKLEEDKQEEEEEEAQTTATEVNGALVPDAAGETTEKSESYEAIADNSAQEKAATTPTEQATSVEASHPETTAEAAPSASAEAPPAKKTWASMLGGGGAKAPAIPALPVTTPATQPKAARPSQSVQAPKASVEPTPAANTASSTPTSQSNGWQTADHGKKGRPQNKASSEGTVLAYIKNVNEKVDARILREVLENHGELKYFDVSRPRVSGLSDSHGGNMLTSARIAPLSNLLILLATPQPSLLTLTPLVANRSMSRSVALVPTPTEVVTPTSPVEAARLGAVVVACRVVVPAAKPTFPRMLAAEVFSREAASLAR